MTQFPEMFAALAAPFDPREVKTRPGSHGRQLHYVTASTIANRLDSVLGPESWDFDVAPWGENALIGTLVVRLPDGSVLRKSNVGGKAEMPAGDDSTKSAASDCLKRCAALLGVARYLYGDGVPYYADPGEVQDAAPAPQLAPQRADDERHGIAPAYVRDPAPARQQAAPSNGHNGAGNYPSTPRTGRAMFAWTKEQEQKHGVKLLDHLNRWSKQQGYPGRMVDWQAEEVAAAHAEAVRKLRGDQAPEPQAAARDAAPAPCDVDEEIPF